MAKKKATKKSAKKTKKKSTSAKSGRKSSAKRGSATRKVKSTRKGKGRAAAASRKTARKKTATRKPAAKKPGRKGTASSAPMPAGGMYGEGNWKADEEYQEGVKEFSEGHDAEQLAGEAGEEMEEEEGLHTKPDEEAEEDSEW